MELTIAALKSAGAFCAAPIKKDVTWHVDGEPKTATVYIRQESFGTITQRWEQQDQGADLTAARIASSICDKDGAAVFTVADIVGDPSTGHGPLTAELTIALLAAISAANGLVGGAELKKSTPRKSSGTTSSSTGSVAGRSRKQKPA